MSDYQQKYLKYKTKYLQLKNDSSLQKGGYTYDDGKYYFFVFNEPNNTKNQ